MGLVAFWFFRRGMGCENQRVRMVVGLNAVRRWMRCTEGEKREMLRRSHMDHCPGIRTQVGQAVGLDAMCGGLCVAVEARDQLGL